MKTYRYLICLCLLCASGCHYFAVLGGHGGEYDATNVSVEVGAYETNTWLNTIGFGYINSSLDHGFYHYERGPELLSYIKFGPEILPGCYGQGIGGVTFTREESYGDEAMQVEGLYGGGLTWFFDDLCVTLNYDNRRGLNGGIGFRW